MPNQSRPPANSGASLAGDGTDSGATFVGDETDSISPEDGGGTDSGTTLGRVTKDVKGGRARMLHFLDRVAGTGKDEDLLVAGGDIVGSGPKLQHPCVFEITRELTDYLKRS